MSDGWDFLDLSDCCNEIQKKVKAWNHYNSEYAQKEVFDPRGNRVIGFTEERFKHVISGRSGDYRLIHIHDMPFDEGRVLRIPWIGSTLSARNCQLELRKEIPRDPRNRGNKVKLYLVVDMQYVVVLHERKGALRFTSAYPVSESALERKRRNSMLLESYSA